MTFVSRWNLSLMATAVALVIAAGCGDDEPSSQTDALVWTDAGGDAGERDATVTPDVGRVDAAVTVDAGVEDLGAVDLGVADAAVDAVVVDASPADASPMDASLLDASPGDASPLDASPLDASPLDASPLDASPGDASPMDASPMDAAPEPCTAEGESVPVIPGALPCCAGLAPIGCEQPLADDSCPEGCVGAVICARCGDGVCGAGENHCNCPQDCAAGACRQTPDCVDHPAPIRCVGTWRCDPRNALPSSHQGPDGCNYTCNFELQFCQEGADCPGGDVCRDCPVPGSCDENARVCFDPSAH